MEHESHDHAAPGARPGSLRAKLALVAATGLFIGGAVIGLSGVASAADPSAEPEVERQEESSGDELSGAEAAAFAEFDACLAGEGVDVEALFADDQELSDVDFEELDRAFDVCDSVLEEAGLFEDGDVEDGDVEGVEEEAFAELEACLVGEGVDVEALFADDDHELTDAEHEELDRAFDACDSVLEEPEFFEDGDFEDCEDGDYEDGDYEDGDYDDEEHEDGDYDDEEHEDEQDLEEDGEVIAS